MYRHRKKVARPNILLVVLIFVAMLTAGFFAVKQTQARMTTPASSEQFVVGVNTPFPPFEDRKGEEVIGFDIDLIKNFAEKQGKTVVVKDYQDFYALLPALVAGKLDIVISAVSITPEREDVVSFSKPYFTTSQGVIAKKGSTLKVTSTQDFANLTVGVQEGSTSETWVKENLTKPATSFGELGLGLELLRLGKVDVIMVDKPVADSYAKQSSDIVVVGNIDTGETYGIAVQKGDPRKILPDFNKLIDSPDYQKLVVKWFGGK